MEESDLLQLYEDRVANIESSLSAIDSMIENIFQVLKMHNQIFEKAFLGNLELKHKP